MPGGFGDDTDEGGRYGNFGAVNPLDPSVANGQISPAEWEEYQRRRRRAALIGGLTTVGGMLAAGPIAQAFGAGSGAGSAASESLAPISGGSPWAVSPYVGSATMAPTGAAAAGGSIGAGAVGAGGGAGAFMGMNPRDAAALAMQLGS